MSATDAPRRLTLADAYRDSHESLLAALTRSPSEPSASASVETTAKGEPKPDVKLYAPMGCDYEALGEHARQVTDIAVAAYARAVIALAALNEEVPF